MSEGSEYEGLSQGAEGEEEQDQRAAMLEAVRPLLLYVCLLDEMQRRFGGGAAAWREAGGQAYADDERNVREVEELCNVFEAQLAPDRVTEGELLARLGGLKGEGEEGQGRLGEDDVVPLVRYGERLV
jgi:hypothetical protein